MNIRTKGGFGMISNNVMRDPDITLREKAIYSYLCTYANSKTNELYVGVDKMAAECGVDHSTIKRILKSLVKKGVIKRMARGNLNSSVTTILK
jgi:DNA-binding MarR family transcriptional regulator